MTPATVIAELLEHSVTHYGHPKDETCGVGLLHAQARAFLAAPSSLAGGARERIKTILDEETTVGGTSASRSGAVNSDELAGLILAALAPEAPAEGAGEVLMLEGNPFGTGLSEPRLVRARSSAPEAREGEPVGVVYSLKADLNTAELPDGTLLYTHPAHPSADKLRAAVEALRTPGDDAECAAYNSALDDLYEALK